MKSKAVFLILSLVLICTIVRGDTVDGQERIAASLITSTVGGATPYFLISAASTNGTNIKSSAGQIYDIVVINSNAAIRYIKLYDKATSPTVGTDTPVHTYPIPAATTGSGFVLSIPVGMIFSAGIGFGLTTGSANNDTGAVAAGEIIVNIDYK